MSTTFQNKCPECQRETTMMIHINGQSMCGICNERLYPSPPALQLGSSCVYCDSSAQALRIQGDYCDRLKVDIKELTQENQNLRREVEKLRPTLRYSALEEANRRATEQVSKRRTSRDQKK